MFSGEYVVPLGKKAITVGVTFTPDFSVAGDCQEVEANPPRPDVLVERTFENRQFHDTLTWIAAAKALSAWNVPARVDVACPVEDVRRKARELGLQIVDAPR